MKFKVGDLVKIISSHDCDTIYDQPAVIIRRYCAEPKILLHNEKANRAWLEQEGISSEIVYDIVYRGCIKEAVRGEWLRHFQK